MIKFSERLKELRMENHLKQSELANFISVDQRSISNWEKGVRQPDFEMLEKIAKFFDVTTDYLLGISE